MKPSIRGVAAAALSLVVLASLASSQAIATTHKGAPFNARTYLKTHGYLPLRGVATLKAMKAYAAAQAAKLHPAANTPSSAAAPTIGSSWKGVVNQGFTPPDPNGAIGPNSYVEIVNTNIAIYQRNGSLVATSLMSALTGHSNGSDPMVLYDPGTQRFYYNIWDTTQATMQWGFSKNANPTSLPGSFCNYSASFGYQTTNFPDYPKLGQSGKFLMIGVNFYPTITSQVATRSDLLWITKPQGRDPITTCPAASTFKNGKFTDLRNQDGSQAFTPVPAIQTDPNKNGFVVASSDTECPPMPCPNGNLITVYGLRPSSSDPTVPQLSPPHSITRGTYTGPPDAPQKGSSFDIDTLDGRLSHAVSAVDPVNNGGKVAIWTAQAILGGAGSEDVWYEINPLPLSSPSIVQQGTISSNSLYVWNAAVSPDRTFNTSGQAAHGGTMVAGFTTSSANAFPAIQMVSKVGAGAQSAFVLVKQSATADLDFGCAQLG
ncbi:MAG TPA: hypothetical protein VGH10_02895, partial [Actinomycetota bacterium]